MYIQQSTGSDHQVNYSYVVADAEKARGRMQRKPFGEYDQNVALDFLEDDSESS